jgi:hypothetical protein
MLDRAMTLREFLDATAGVPEPALRAAMTTALAVEPARTPGAYHRFYDRVVHELDLHVCGTLRRTDAERSSTHESCPT